MKFGIIGPGSMAMTWEHHLRNTMGVQEVVIAPRVDMLQHVDAVIIPGNSEDSEKHIHLLKDALRRGYHVLWVAPPPTDPESIRSCLSIATESGAIVMFAMWSYYSPATQWLFNHIPSPTKIHIHREWSGPQHTPDTLTLNRIFLEEISLCLEWCGSEPVHIEGDLPPTNRPDGNRPEMRQLHLRFGNDASATLFMNPYGLENRHSRFIKGKKMAAVCQINNHIIKKWFLDGEQQKTPQVMRFGYREPAQHLLSHFTRSIRSAEKPAFGITELDHLMSQLHRFPKP